MAAACRRAGDALRANARRIRGFVEVAGLLCQWNDLRSAVETIDYKKLR